MRQLEQAHIQPESTISVMQGFSRFSGVMRDILEYMGVMEGFVGIIQE